MHKTQLPRIGHLDCVHGQYLLIDILWSCMVFDRTSYYLLLLRTRDKIFLKLTIDNKNVIFGDIIPNSSSNRLDSVPFGVPQMAGAPESLHVWLENREMVAVDNIYCGNRVFKRKINFRR